MFKSIFNKLVLFTILYSLFFVQYTEAQLDLGVPTIEGKAGTTTMLKDYEAIGVNPANLGWDDNNRFSIGIGYIGFNFQSKALNFHELVSTLSNSNNNNNDDNDTQINELSKLLTNGNRLNINTNINLIALSLHWADYGGFSFSVRDRIISRFSANITSQASLDTLLKGNSNAPSISSVFKSASGNVQYLREFNLAYGVKLKELFCDDLDIYGGIGYRYILGLGYINVGAENGYASAMTTLNNNNYNDLINNISTNMFNADGHGSAIDLGANAIYLDKFKFGISLIDLGFIRWRPMQIEKANTTMLKVDSLQKHVNNFNDLFNQNGLWSESPSSTTYLPTKLRIGAGIKVSEFFEVGADITSPLNRLDRYKDKTFISLGGELNVFKFLKINTGFTGSPNIGWNIPVGITFSAGWYDFYIATNDILTYIGKASNPMVSFAFCAIRFNIPPPRKAEQECDCSP